MSLALASCVSLPSRSGLISPAQPVLLRECSRICDETNPNNSAIFSRNNRLLLLLFLPLDLRNNLAVRVSYIHRTYEEWYSSYSSQLNRTVASLETELAMRIGERRRRRRSSKKMMTNDFKEVITIERMNASCYILIKTFIQKAKGFQLFSCYRMENDPSTWNTSIFSCLFSISRCPYSFRRLPLSCADVPS